jgi:molybdopterin-guanine dinucleotide biosynthesis protein A
VYEVSSLPIVRRAFQEGEYSLRRVLEQVHSVRVEGADPGRLRSVDTPEAYHRALGSSGLL